MDADDRTVPEYSDADRDALTANLLAITAAVRDEKLSARPLVPELLLALHLAIFEGVRSHAGRMRSSGFGSEFLLFGRCRSFRRDEVGDAIGKLLRQLRTLIAEIEAQSDADFSVRDALRVALWAHSEVVRIHPFEDGNGRTARLFLSVLLVRLGLRPIAIEAPKKEYTDALDLAFDGNLEVLVDLYLRLADEQL